MNTQYSITKCMDFFKMLKIVKMVNVYDADIYMSTAIINYNKIFTVKLL